MKQDDHTASLTDAVKEELASTSVTERSSLIAELAALLRFCSTVRREGTELVLDAEVETEKIARRVVAACESLFHEKIQLNILGTQENAPHRYLLHLQHRTADISRMLGLIDRTGQGVRGLPATVVGGSVEDAAAAWRGAFLAKGTLSDPERSASVDLVCPGPEVALAMVGLARRLSVTAKTREVKKVWHVQVRDSSEIGTLLNAMGATELSQTWEKRRKSHETHAPGHRFANFDDANMRRSLRSALETSARVERAFEILGENIPPKSRKAGELRLQYRDVSLEQLGRLADPPMTKDAIAGQLRRLNRLADKRAAELGIPDTWSALQDESEE